jgi:hypothetical protein
MGGKVEATRVTEQVATLRYLKHAGLSGQQFPREVALFIRGAQDPLVLDEAVA